MYVLHVASKHVCQQQRHTSYYRSSHYSVRRCQQFCFAFAFTYFGRDDSCHTEQSSLIVLEILDYASRQLFRYSRVDLHTTDSSLGKIIEYSLYDSRSGFDRTQKNHVVLPFCHARPKAARGSPTENGPQPILEGGFAPLEKRCQCGETTQISGTSIEAGGFAWSQWSPALHHVCVAVIKGLSA